MTQVLVFYLTRQRIHEVDVVGIVGAGVPHVMDRCRHYASDELLLPNDVWIYGRFSAGQERKEALRHIGAWVRATKKGVGFSIAK
jgi:hypothetical protein